MLKRRAGTTAITFIGTMLLLALFSSDGRLLAQSEGEVAAPSGVYSSIHEALANSTSGDTLILKRGVFKENIVIDKSVNLVGEGWPVIDGSNSGNVITVNAPEVTLTGLIIQNSGDKLAGEDAGIEVNAPNVLIEKNRIKDTLFGIYLKQAAHGLIKDNVITGMDLEVQRRGDGIRVWYSSDTVIEGNDVSMSRDVVLWYSERLVVKDNDIHDGRYGLHFMYDDDALVENNRLTNNSVGAFLMYSRRLSMIGNVVGDNRGPSGYGIGLKDLDNAYIKGNLFADNRVGAYVDNSPRESKSTVEFIDNVFVLNDFGVRLMPSVKRNEYTGNSFVDNQEQVQVAGRGTIKENTWATNGIGNYWSDYAGFDSNNDGIGDIEYRSEKLFESLTDKNPNLRVLTFSPVTQAIDFAARSFPFVRPEPKLVDPFPLSNPGEVAGLKLDSDSEGWKVLITSATMLLLAGLMTRLGSVKDGGSGAPAEKSDDSPNDGSPTAESVLILDNISKTFGDVKAVDGLSFSVAPGTATALWGNNGAGKTTALRCILSQMPYEGSVNICGFNTKSDGKKARAKVGLVPQEISFHDDLTVQDTMRLYSRLRRAGRDEGAELLERLSLTIHESKQVRQLSGGLRQRLALAIALLGDPPLLLLDEPTANLDALARQDFLRLLEDLKAEGKAMVFASHRPGEVLRLADTVLHLEHGKLTSTSGPKQFIAELAGLQRMRIEVGLDQVDSAAEALTAQNFSISKNASGVHVSINPNAKAKPIEALIAAGITVDDFELEWSERGELDD